MEEASGPNANTSIMMNLHIVVEVTVSSTDISDSIFSSAAYAAPVLI